MSDKLILERYRPIAQLGAGGFATVQLAWDVRLQRRVAIKRLQLDEEAAALMEGSDEVSAYELDCIPGLAEARTAAMFQDQNIAGAIDFRVQDGFAYLIMEYIDGITLGTLLDDYADRITLDVVAAVFAGVSHALEVAHANQVLHLDIKPDNVIINHQGEVKVTDFGLAELSSASGYSKASGGTIGYMPLEQMRLEPLDARCDEWALASVTYEMLTGCNPFLAPDLKRAQAAIEEAEVLLPSIARPELEEEADDVLFCALDPDREERYDTVEDFAEELLPYLGSVKRGTRQLARLVGEAADDAGESEEEGTEKMPANGGGAGFASLQRLGSLVNSDNVMRVWSAVSCGFIAYLAVMGNSWLDGAPVYVKPIAFIAICLAGVAVPHLGAVLSLVALSAAFASQASYFCAALAAISGIVWWVMLGRRGLDEPAVMLSPASMGAFGCAGVSPLASGLNLDVREAFTNLLCSAGVATVLATLGSQTIAGWRAASILPTVASRFTGCDQVLLNMISQPSFWIVLASWVLAAAAVAAVSGWGGMVRRSLAILVGAAILGAGLVAQSYLASAVLVPPAEELFVLIAMTAIAFAYSIARPA